EPQRAVGVFRPLAVEVELEALDRAHFAVTARLEAIDQEHGITLAVELGGPRLINRRDQARGSAEHSAAAMHADDGRVPPIARRAEEITIERGRLLTRAIILKRGEMNELLRRRTGTPEDCHEHRSQAAKSLHGWISCSDVSSFPAEIFTCAVPSRVPDS